MDVNKSFCIKQTTNLSRTRIDTIKYKVDVNTMEHLSLENGQDVYKRQVFTFVGCVNFTPGGDSLECLPVGTYQCINRKFIKFE